MPARWPAGLDSRRLPEPLVVLLLSAFSISDPISQIGEFSSLSRYIFLYFDNTLGRTQKYRVLRQSCWVSLLYSSYQIGQNLHHSSMNVRGHWRWSVWTEIPVEILVQRSIKVCCHKTGSHVTWVITWPCSTYLDGIQGLEGEWICYFQLDPTSIVDRPCFRFTPGVWSILGSIVPFLLLLLSSPLSSRPLGIVCAGVPS